MAGITKQQAQAQLQLWLEADAAVAKNQSYTIGTRQWTRADASEITEKIEYWQAKLDSLSGNSRRGIVNVVPR